MHESSTFEYLDRTIVTGVEWLNDKKDGDDDYNPKALAKAAIKEMGIAKPGVVKLRLYSEVVQVGLADLGTLGIKTGYPLAALYAHYQHTYSNLHENSEAKDSPAWIVIERTDSGYWTSLIVNGTVIVESDANLSLEQVTEIAQEHLTLAESANHKRALVGSGVKDVDTEESEITLGSIFKAFADEDWNSVVLKSASGDTVKNALMLTGIVAGVVVLGIQFGVISFGESDEDIRRKQVEASKAAVADYYKKLLSQPSFKESLNVVAQSLEGKQLFDSPWPFRSASCDTSGNCLVSFINPENFSTSYALNYLTPRCDHVDVSPQGHTANCSFYIQFPQNQNVQAGENILEFTEQLMTFANNGLETKIANPAKSNISGGSLAPSNLIKREGAWEMQGRYTDAVSVAGGLGDLGWAKAKSIRVEQSGSELNIKVEGAYVIN
ncbi:type 4b pilus protein PilO2 [Neptuniibacter halophilus]|uniref:type 4b pilus protein PilO2 n=1 Tax=Neptuniibacter halophilus TaxID=651666 RepID=UPI002573E7BB|nr:type 4b pilus protein PilO2 [Neptuniibacter halophilus]